MLNANVMIHSHPVCLLIKENLAIYVVPQMRNLAQCSVPSSTMENDAAEVTVAAFYSILFGSPRV